MCITRTMLSCCRSCWWRVSVASGYLLESFLSSEKEANAACSSKEMLAAGGQLKNKMPTLLQQQSSAVYFEHWKSACRETEIWLCFCVWIRFTMDLVVDPQIQMDLPKVLEVLGMQMSPNGKMLQSFTHTWLKIGDKRGVDDEKRRDEWSGEKWKQRGEETDREEDYRRKAELRRICCVGGNINKTSGQQLWSPQVWQLPIMLKWNFKKAEEWDPDSLWKPPECDFHYRNFSLIQLPWRLLPW